MASLAVVGRSPFAVLATTTDAYELPAEILRTGGDGEAWPPSFLQEVRRITWIAGGGTRPGVPRRALRLRCVRGERAHRHRARACRLDGRAVALARWRPELGGEGSRLARPGALRQHGDRSFGRLGRLCLGRRPRLLHIVAGRGVRPSVDGGDTWLRDRHSAGGGRTGDRTEQPAHRISQRCLERWSLSYGQRRRIVDAARRPGHRPDALQVRCRPRQSQSPLRVGDAPVAQRRRRRDLDVDRRPQRAGRRPIPLGAVDWSAPIPVVYAIGASGIVASTANPPDGPWSLVPGSGALGGIRALLVASAPGAPARRTLFAATATGVHEFTPDPDGKYVPVYRFYNRYTDAHFYTADPAERAHALRTIRASSAKASRSGRCAHPSPAPLPSTGFTMPRPASTAIRGIRTSAIAGSPQRRRCPTRASRFTR